ncbi:hypothetical protein FisN_14Hh111 [Fistulifera solaris]|uniref:Peptidase M43 pregnancy-associated plasma-A domain-containing protein n=1 Tax=Fistulifera solaris TaxID=1519565 RepID=A0A1Z5K8P7_FISSO|nr:hypothetical protein FisN_14Hh111 [Fistulifera solaris]|eukprot:GAX22491.1 hypothetical protein FisN_14Hh111 [Fistulifera solaris]
MSIRYLTIALLSLLQCQPLLCHRLGGTLDEGHHDAYDEHPHPFHSHRSLQEEFRNEDGIPICGFPEPSDADLREIEAAQNISILGRFAKFATRFWRSLRQRRKSIPTYYHIIQSATIAGPSEEQVRAQHDHLVEAFAPYGFSFTLKDITFTKNDDWFGYKEYNTDEERDMKKTLRRGGPESLNVYVNNGKGVCGYAYLPKFYSQFPWNDGIVINFRCFGGASESQEGDVVVHEVGHWLGLLHPFSNCAEPGDGISDTPLQGLPTRGCPAEPVNSCGKGFDSADNYMDYSSDACKTRFTAGQAERMEEEWNKYRL